MVKKGDAWSPDRNIVVDADTIERSVIGVSSHCMIAEAIKKAVPDARAVAVDLQTIRWSDRERRIRYVYLTPPSVQQALVDFDQGELIEPFTFRVRHAQIHRTAGPRPHRDTASSTEAGRSRRALDKATLVMKHDRRDGPPIRVGGQLPPVAALSSARGRIRTFGLRNLRPPRAAADERA